MRKFSHKNPWDVIALLSTAFVGVMLASVIIQLYNGSYENIDQW